MLSAGTFSLYSTDSPEGIRLNKGVTLRGTGTCNNTRTPYCQTVLDMVDGTIPFGTTCGNQSACDNNNAPGVIVGVPGFYFWSKCSYAGGGTCAGATPLDADAAQGATTIQVHSTSNFSVGMWVLIDEASGASYQADPLWGSMSGYSGTQVWAASDAFNNTSAPATGRVIWMKHNPTITGDDFNSTTYPYTAESTGCYFSFCDRPTSEIHKITAIGAGPCPGTSCTLTFDSPLTIAFRQSGSHNAQVYYPTANDSSSYTPFVQNAGVENMTIELTDGGGVKFQYCAYCWAKNVEVYHWRDDAVAVAYSARVQIDSVYSHECTDSEPSGVEYPFDLMFSSTEVYIVNSITRTCGKGMTIRSAGAGSVVAYNWIDQTLYFHNISGGDSWVETSLDGSHAAGSHEVLFEGNMAPNMDDDDTHGNVVYHTYFRNWATGFRYSSFVDPSDTSVTIDDTTDTPGGNGPYRAAGPMGYDYWFSYIGNVMGTAGLSTTANGWSYQNGTYGGAGAKQIWMAGWNNLPPYPNTGDPNLNGAGTHYVFRHGNYDYVTGGLVWDPNTPNHTLPDSLYLTSAPAFFSAGATCTYPWPWVTPTGSPQIQTNSCAGSGLPALARFNAGTPFVQP
jgi:hypothetical protein